MVETARTAETLWDALNREEVELASGVSWEEVVSSTMHFVGLAYRAGGDEAQVSLHACWVDWIIQQWAYVDCKNSRLAAEIAALQGRAFEDGARWMRERAAESCGEEGSFHVSTADDLSTQYASACVACHDLVSSLPLQPEGERNA